MQVTKTARGFTLINFTDRYGEGCSIEECHQCVPRECSLQDSSLATEAAIWLGVDDPMPQMLSRDAPDEWRKPADDPERLNGWVTVPLPKGTFIHGRMHLTQKEVRDLLPLLTVFAEFGALPPPVSDE